MDWERTGKIAGKFFLLLLEYSIKLSATIVGLAVLGAKGSFGTKLADGFASLSPALRQLFETPGKISDMVTVISDYNTLTAAAFNEHYGSEAVNGVLNYLNEGILYFQAIYQNIIYQPFATVFAAGIAFFALYLLARVLRFARQQGQGSYFTRMERKLGDRVFQPPPDKRPQPRPQPQTKVQPEQKNRDKEYFRKKFNQRKIETGPSFKN